MHWFKWCASVLVLGTSPLLLFSQTGCDPSLAPTNLQSVYTPGSGALLTWDPVPGSVGVRLKAVLPGGASVKRNIIGPEPDHFLVPDGALSPGLYTWYVQATCTLVPPYALSPISAPDTFAVGGGSTCPATLVDADGNAYPTVLVGGQCWQGENLAVTHYANGDSIPTGLTNVAWQNTTSGAYDLYEGLPAHAAEYGLLYNQFATVDPRGLCPDGWHVPSNAEWATLFDGLGGTAVAAGPLKEAGTLHWQAPNTGASNSTGLTILPSGFRYDEGGFSGIGQYGYYWTSTFLSGYLAYHRAFSYLAGAVYSNISSRPNGYAVRCLKD